MGALETSIDKIKFILQEMNIPYHKFDMKSKQGYINSLGLNLLLVILAVIQLSSHLFPLPHGI